MVDVKSLQSGGCGWIMSVEIASAVATNAGRRALNKED